MMRTRQVGERVFAVSHADEENVYVFGRGVYEGEFVPEEAGGFMAELIRGAGRQNPRIRLDDGQAVYGCECWWGPERMYDSVTAGKTVVPVSIVEKRLEAAQ